MLRESTKQAAEDDPRSDAKYHANQSIQRYEPVVGGARAESAAGCAPRPYDSKDAGPE